ncbi:MAG: type III-A CRISPR-associated RAMP protein Csm4, partial [Candidatus Brocadiales bacterium]
METYRLRLKLVSSFITPWQADTIFGSLCWTFVRHYGAQKLKEFLTLYREGQPPFILSSGFPGNLLPVPLSAHFIFMNHTNEPPAIEIYEKLKTIKKLPFIKINQFNDILHLRSFEVSPS